MELEASITCHRAQGHSVDLVMIAAKNCRLVSRSGKHRNNEEQAHIQLRVEEVLWCHFQTRFSAERCELGMALGLYFLGYGGWNVEV